VITVPGTVVAALLALLATGGPAHAAEQQATTVANAALTRAGVTVSDTNPDGFGCRQLGFCGGVFYRTVQAGEPVRVVNTRDVDARFTEVEAFFGGSELRRGFVYTAEVRPR
jgi:hypothetical protein